MGDRGEEEQKTNTKGGNADESRVKRHKKSCNRVTAEAKAFAHNESRKPCVGASRTYQGEIFIGERWTKSTRAEEASAPTPDRSRLR